MGQIPERSPTQAEYDDIIDYWFRSPRGTGYYDERSMINFLKIFTPDQIKYAIHVATKRPRASYFRFMCGILRNWRQYMEVGEPISCYPPPSRDGFPRLDEENPDTPA